MNENATVYVVDDDQATREAITRLVRDMGLKSTAYSSAKEFLESYERVGTDCLILDVRMPVMSGMELLEKLSEEKISIPIILITGFGEIAMAVEALQKGAVDFVEKPFREQALWVKINKALRISDNAFVLDTERKNLANKLSLLTKKESEILKHLLTGKTNNQIANDLDCVRRTVAFHRSNILKRLEISSTVELAQTFCKLNDII